ncbi:MAG: type 2 isopentenyl-diphosphate Delta-isomerase [Elusimicrobia bacterium]|nr:type 2 isopentenyl-diphosphate Delta-isomerase [Elusimicrobiota bacterium]
MAETMIGARKLDHLKLCLEMDVEYREKTTLLEDVHLVHQALSDASFDDVRIETPFMGRTLKAPLLISALTGGVPEAESLNRDLARAAQELGVALCLGSQRPMLKDRDAARSYRVRRFAPDVPILGNIGVQQAAQVGTDRTADLVRSIEADGLAVHLNIAQELSQPEGDRSFPGGCATIRALAKRLPGRVMVKETGCGLSRETAARLKACGVRTVDVAGAGGTSWPRVESLRKTPKQPQRTWLDEWGIPTAASLWEVGGLGLTVVASGGIRNGLDVAKSLAMGADLVGMALPVLRSHGRGAVEAGGRASRPPFGNDVGGRGGYDGVVRFLSGVITELKTAMLLAGADDVAALRRTGPVITGRLKEWISSRKRR